MFPGAPIIDLLITKKLINNVSAKHCLIIKATCTYADKFELQSFKQELYTMQHDQDNAIDVMQNFNLWYTNCSGLPADDLVSRLTMKTLDYYVSTHDSTVMTLPQLTLVDGKRNVFCLGDRFYNEDNIHVVCGTDGFDIGLIFHTENYSYIRTQSEHDTILPLLINTHFNLFKKVKTKIYKSTMNDNRKVSINHLTNVYHRVTYGKQ